jgi:hypothetical protein
MEISGASKLSLCARFGVSPSFVDGGAKLGVGKPCSKTPGWGFIIAPTYEDVWQDDGLLL